MIADISADNLGEGERVVAWVGIVEAVTVPVGPDLEEGASSYDCPHHVVEIFGDRVFHGGGRGVRGQKVIPGKRLREPSPR